MAAIKSSSNPCQFCNLVGSSSLKNDLRSVNYDLDLTRKQKVKFLDEEVRFFYQSLVKTTIIWMVCQEHIF